MLTDTSASSDPLSSPELLDLDARFAAEATQVLGRLRKSVEQLVYEVTTDIQNSRSLLNALGIDLNLSWQLFRLLGPIETLATAQFLPAPVSFKKLIAAAKKKGVSAVSLATAAAAYADVERLIAETTGNQDEFEAVLVSYLGIQEASAAGIAHRKARFKADVYFHGFSVDLLRFSLFFHPAPQGKTLDFLGIRQMFGLRRLKAGTSLVIDRWRMTGSQGTESLSPLADALDQQAATAHDAAILPEFCSKPLPSLVTRMDAAGNARTLLRHRDIGIGRSINLTTARISRNLPHRSLADGRLTANGLIEIARPTRAQSINIFVHRPTFGSMSPRSGFFSQVTRRESSLIEEDSVRLPFSEELKFAGPADAFTDEHAPKNSPNVERWVCQRMGWNFHDFDCYHIYVDYPLMDSTVQCVLEQAEPPASPLNLH